MAVEQHAIIILIEGYICQQCLSDVKIKTGEKRREWLEMIYNAEFLWLRQKIDISALTIVWD